MQVAEPGMRKNELVAEIYHAGVKGHEGHYGDYASFVPLIGAGEEAAACHMTWNDEPLKNNEGMFLRAWCCLCKISLPLLKNLIFRNTSQRYLDIEKVINECIVNAIENV